MTKSLHIESNPTPLLREGAGFRAVLITPGKGSSGTYSESMLAESGAAAFPPGTLAFVDHPTEQNPGRSARNIIGTYPEGARFEAGVGLVSNLVPLPHWADWVEAVAPHTGLSIYAMGESDVHGNVTALLPDTQNSVDLVAYPGRPGSGLTQMYEAAVAFSSDRPTVGATQKETKMTPEQEAKLDKLATLFESFVAETKTVATAQVKESVDAEGAAKATAVRVEATIVALEAINKADLPAALREGLVLSVKAGNTDVAALIESAKTLHAAVKAEVAATTVPTVKAGHVVSEASETSNTDAFNKLFEVK